MTEDVWKSLHIDGRLTKQEELLARVYLGGVSSQIRKEVRNSGQGREVISLGEIMWYMII